MSKDSETGPFVFTLLHQCWRTARQNSFPTELRRAYGCRDWKIYGTRHEPMNYYNFILYERLRWCHKCSELDWNSKLLWSKYHKTPFIPFVDGHIFTLLFIYFQKEVIMVSQMSQRSFVLHSPGTWQRRSAACVTPCSVFSPDQFVFFVAKVKNVHVMCMSRKIMGIKSPLKVFSAARQKIVLQMGASDERGGGPSLWIWLTLEIFIKSDNILSAVSSAVCSDAASRFPPA